LVKPLIENPEFQKISIIGLTTLPGVPLIAHHGLRPCPAAGPLFPE
jgi:hypothetical protein